MEIRLNSSKTAIVTFYEIKERRIFGERMTIFSLESIRSSWSRVSIMTYLEEDIPQSKEISHIKLGLFLGSIVTIHKIEGYPDYTFLTKMADKTNHYFQ